MSLDFDQFPVYDPVLKNKTNSLSDIWVGSFSSFYQTLITYLSQSGIFMPILTTDQRDALVDPQNGQMIYNSTLGSAQYFKPVLGVGTWVSF